MKNNSTPSNKSQKHFFERFIVVDTTAKKTYNPELKKEISLQIVRDSTIGRKAFLYTISKKNLNAFSESWLSEVKRLIRLKDPNILDVYDLHQDETHYAVSSQFHNYSPLDLVLNEIRTSPQQRKLFTIELLQQWISNLIQIGQHLGDKHRLYDLVITPDQLLVDTKNKSYGKLILDPLQPFVSFKKESTYYEHYSSPESLDDTPYRVSSLIYNIAILLFELVTLSPYNKKRALPSTLRSQKFPCFEEIPARWDYIIRNNLSQNPLERANNFKTFKELILRSSFISEELTRKVIAIEEWEKTQQDITLNPEKEDTESLLSNEQFIELEKKLSSSESVTRQLSSEKKSLVHQVNELKKEINSTKDEYNSILKSTDSEQADTIVKLKNEAHTLKEQIALDHTKHKKTLTENSLLRDEAEELRSKQNEFNSIVNNRASELTEISTQRDSLIEEINTLKSKEKPVSTPILVFLSGMMLLGLGGGYIAHTMLPNKADSLENADIGSIQILPEKVNSSSSLITVKLFKVYAQEQSINEKDLTILLPSLKNAADDSPVEEVPYWLAENFCNWLSIRSLSIQQKQNGYFYRMPNSSEAKAARLSSDKNPEWTIEPKFSTQAKSKYLGRLVLSSGSKQLWQIPNLGKTSTKLPISFRVTLSKQ